MNFPREQSRPWTTKELQRLRDVAPLGAEEAARALERSVGSVIGAAHRHRISLRREGSRCGSILGQPRGVSIVQAIRDDVLDGVVDDELMAERMRVDADAALCPACGYRPTRVRRTGLCLPCHRRRLAEAHREQIEELEALRDVNAAKQQAKRVRDSIGERQRPV